MKLFIENTFSLNNHISISNKIKTNPLFFLYFSTINHVKSLDKNYNELNDDSSSHPNKRHKKTSNHIQDIKYKIIRFHLDQFIPTKFNETNFTNHIYHVFYASSILSAMNISFTLTDTPFISPVDSNTCAGNNLLPLLHDFSYSFNFSVINYNNIRMYFPSLLLNNIYSSIEVYLITYLIHHNINILTPELAHDIRVKYMKHRDMIISSDTIDNYLSRLNDLNLLQIINCTYKSKHTWTFYSLCYYFIVHHSDLLTQHHLYELFHSYIQSAPNIRDINVITTIYTILFG